MSDVTFDIELGGVTLTVDQVWPDGDAPENPTAQDVADCMKAYGGLHSVISDWLLITGIQIRARGSADWAEFR